MTACQFYYTDVQCTLQRLHDRLVVVTSLTTGKMMISSTDLVVGDCLLKLYKPYDCQNQIVAGHWHRLRVQTDGKELLKEKQEYKQWRY